MDQDNDTNLMIKLQRYFTVTAVSTGVGTMFKNVPVVLSEALEVRDGPLTEPEIWAFLFQGSRAIQLLFSKENRYRVDGSLYTITPDTLLCCSNGQVRIAESTLTHNKNSVYYPPELYSTTHHSDWALEKMCVFSLGKTLCYCAEYRADRHKRRKLSHGLQLILRSMSDGNPLRRMNMVDVLKACIQHGSWEQKPYSHYIIQLYELVLGPPQKVEGDDSDGSKVCEHGERIHKHRHKNTNNKKHHSSFCVHYLSRTSDISNQNKPLPPPKKWSHSFAHVSDLRSLPDGWSKSDHLSFEGGHSRPTSMSRHSSESSENTSPIRQPFLHKDKSELIIPYWVQNCQVQDSDHSNNSDESGSFVKPIVPSKEYSIDKSSVDKSQQNEESDEKQSIPEVRILSGSADAENEKERENSPPLPTRSRSRSKMRTQNSMGLHDSQRIKRRQQRYSFSDDGRNSDSLWNALREQRERLRNMHKMRKNKDRHRHTVSSDPLDVTEKRSMLSVSSIFEGSYRPNLSPQNSLNGVPFIELLTQEIEEIKRKEAWEKNKREKLVEVRASTLPRAMERIKEPKSYGSPDSPPSQPPPQPPIVAKRSASLKKEIVLPKMADVALQTSEELLDSNSNTTTLRSTRSEIGPISIHSSNLEDFTCQKEICKPGKLPVYISERLPPAGSIAEPSDSECSSSTLRNNPLNKEPLDRKTSGASDNCKQPKEFYGPEFVLKGGEPNIPVQLVGEKQTSKLWNQPKMVTAVLLNGQRLDIKCLASTTGKQLFDSVVTYLCLGEPFFFGLAYFRDGEYLFLEHDMKLSKCAPPGWNQNKKPLFTFTLYFRVKFYVENINLIRHDFTRHLHYLQMRRDILEGRIQCSEEMALLLAGLALQAEFGDYEEHDCGPGYFRPEHYLPHRVLKQLSIENIESAVADAHKQYSNMADTQAEFQFLRETQHLKEYGIHFHKVLKNKKDFTSLSWIGICTYGLLLYDGTNNQRVLENRFAWQQIRQIAFKKNYFSVLPNTIGDNDKPDKLIYFTDNYRKGRYLLHMCTTHHKFQMKMKSRVNPADIFDHGKIGDIYLPGRGLMELALSINAFSTPGNSLQKSPFPQYSESGSVQVTASVGDSASLNSINLNEVNEDQDAGEVNFLNQAINGPLFESLPDSAKAKFSLSELEQKIASYKTKPMTLASLHQQKLAGIEMPGSNSATPNGSLGKAFVIDESVTANHTVVPSINETINESLLERFARLPSPDSPDELKCLVKLTKNDEYGLGITVVGGHHNGQPAIFIKLVVPGGPAEKNGQLKPGDRIIALNGQKIEGLPHDDAVEMIRKAPHNVEFLIAQRKLRNGETMFLFNEHPVNNSNDSETDEEDNQESQLHEKYNQMENDYDVAFPEPPPFITENDLVLGNAGSEERTVLGEEADKISFTTLSETSMSPPSRVNQHTHQAIVHSEEGGNTLRCTKAAIATLEAAISQYDSQLSDDSEWIDTPRHSQSKNSSKWKLKDTTFKGYQPATNSISKSYLKVDLSNQQTSKNYSPIEISAANFLNTNHLEPTKESLKRTAEGVKNTSLETLQNHMDNNLGTETGIEEEPTEQNVTTSPESYPFVNRNVEFKTPLISNLKDEVFGEIFNVILEKKQGSLGLNVTGGKGTSFKNGCIHVKSLVPGGSADSDGHISVGDKLLEVNGVKLLNVTHKEAVEILRKCGNKVQLRLEREVKLHRSSLSELARLSWHHQAGLNNQDSSPACPTFEKNKTVLDSSTNNSPEKKKTVLDSSTNSSPEKKKTGKYQVPYKFVTDDNTFVVDLQKTNAGLGFSVASCKDPFDNQTTIEILRISKLFPSLPASLCGLLEIGDILLEINETTVKGLSHAETMNLLRASPANVRLKICRPAPEISPSIQNDNSQVNLPTDSLVNKSADPQVHVTGPVEVLPTVNTTPVLPETSSSESVETPTVVSSVFVNIAPPPDQSDIVDVIEPPLPSSEKQEPNQEDLQEIDVTLVKDDIKGLGFTIQSISAQNACYIRSVVQGPALVDGRLKPGDKLVMVNGYDLTKLTHYDVVALLRKTPKTVNLKVVRNVSSESGSLTSSRPCSQNDSLSGSNTSSPVMLREKTISPRGTLSELESEMKDSSRTMVYAPESAVIRIELDKPDNGNLGFSLSSNEKGSGIFIKSINPGGVTAKNAQLLEGDRLLQVNGESVIGLTLPKAIAMLRKSKGKVKLAVSRAPSRSPSRAGECVQPKLNYYYYGETPKSPTVSISSEQSVEQENLKNVTLHSPKKGEEHGFNTDSDVESTLLDNSHVEEPPKDITEEELHKSSSILEFNRVEREKELNKSTHVMHLNHIQDTTKVDKFTHNATRISNRGSNLNKSHEEFIQRKVEDAQMSEQRKIAIEIARLPNKGRYSGENLDKFLALFKAKYNSNLPSEEFEMLMKEKLEFSRRFEDEFDDDEDAVINYVEASVGEDLFRYITYPAPVSGRITEFWKAVWEDEVHVIAMLAAENRNRNSLLLHLPKSTDSPIFCDRLIISLKTLKRSENFIVCHVLIKEQESGDQRHVVHVSFTSWPDQGLPNDPLPLVKLIRCVHFLHKTGPILVHSNVDPGSASIFVIVSTALRSIELDQQVDLYEITSNLQSQSQEWISTKDEYLLCYKALLTALQNPSP